MFYTYILQSIRYPEKFYVGHTVDLRKRLTAYNEGKCTYTATFRPWKVKTYIAFDELTKAQKFELYLKSGSGHEFRRRHF